MSFQALNDVVILKLTHEDKVLESGIVMPVMAQGVPDFGIVQSVGPGLYTDNGFQVPIDLKPGDVVKFNKDYAKGVFLPNDEGEKIEYVWVPAKWCVAVIDGEG